MLVNNFKDLIKYNINASNGVLVDIDNSQDGGNIIYQSNSMTKLASLQTKKISEFGSTEGCTFSVGSGNEALANDYSLKTAITETDFSIVSAHYSNMTYTQVWQYNGSETITINEIGLFAIIKTTWQYYRAFLMAHEILDAPITVDSEHNTFTISMVIG